MNYEITAQLIEEIAPYISSECIVVKENKDWNVFPRVSDSVTVDEKHHVGFEVFDREILIFYFSEHCRFVYADNDQDTYLKRAKKFLTELLTLPICHVETYKGKKRVSEKYDIVYSDWEGGTEVGGIRYTHIRRFCPFKRKSVKTTIWQYDKTKGIVTDKPLKKPSLDAIEVIAVNDTCYIEIFEKNGAFSYCIQKLEFDDYNDIYYWAPSDDKTLSLFDTKAKAVQAAKGKL